ncbi:histone H1.5 [Neosynchiropus ocellatus]
MSSSALPLSPSRVPRRSSAAQRRAAARPSLTNRIMDIVSASTDRTGMSLAALKRSLKDGGYDVEANKSKIRGAVKRMLSNQSLVQTRGAGASGSFKLNTNPPTSGRDRPTTKKRPAKSAKAASRGRSARASTSDESPDRRRPAGKRSKKSSKGPSTSRRATTSMRASTSRRPTTSKRPAAAKKPKSRTKAKAPTRSRTRSSSRK